MAGTTAEHQSAFEQLVADMVLDLPAITDRIVARVEEGMGLHAVSPALADDVRRAVAETTAQGLHALVGGSIDTMRGRITRVAGRRALQGVPLDAALLGYHVALDAMLDEVVERLPPGPEGTALLAEASRAVMAYIQLVTASVARGYQVAALDREDRQQVYLEAVTGRRPGLGEALALDVDLPFRTCLATAALTAAAPALVRALRDAHPGSLVGRLDGRVVLLTSARSCTCPPDVAHGTAPVEPVEQGQPGQPGQRQATAPPVDVAATEATAEAVRRAGAAADVAAHLGRHHADAPAALGLAAVLGLPAADRRAMVGAHLDALGALDQERRGADLVATLATWVRCGYATARTARALGVHRHTLDYRLGRIRACTGLDLDAPVDRLAVELALFVRGDLRD